MLFPAEIVVPALNSTFHRLSADWPETFIDGSASQAIRSALQVLTVRETGGKDLMLRQFTALEALMQELVTLEGEAAPASATWRQLASEIGAIDRQGGIEAFERSWRSMLARTERAMGQVIARQQVNRGVLTTLCRLLTRWEVADRKAEGQTVSATEASTVLSVQNLTAYLQDRFADPGLEVTRFQPLPGGFGKLTTLFDVSGTALSGSFVLRRDAAVVSVDNDCHRIRNEYPVILAVAARGFPAPEALWLDVEHALLPGGDFIVMRKAPGQIGGNVFGAQTPLADKPEILLGRMVAELHRLGPFPELGDLTEGITQDAWTRPLTQTTRLYVENWYRVYQATAHTPSPSVVALYGWIMANMPDLTGTPVLLHADLGFHNILLTDGHPTTLLDWEFAHVGDPAEDLAMLINTSHGAVDADLLISAYEAAGGPKINPRHLLFHRIWGYVRNAMASDLSASRFADRRTADLNLLHVAYFIFPLFLEYAQKLIDQWELPA